MCVRACVCRCVCGGGGGVFVMGGGSRGGMLFNLCYRWFVVVVLALFCRDPGREAGNI